MSGHAGLLRLIRLHLYLVAGRQEGVEADYELGMSLEEHRHPGNNAGSIDRLGLELLEQDE